MSYAKRTCNSCGIRLPQPQMHRVIKEVEVGHSKKGITNREIVGSFLGEKKAINSVQRSLFAPNKRTYTRKREVWMCPSCANQNHSSSSSDGSNLMVWIMVIGFFIFLLTR